jgi:hypothetical protein
LTEWDGSSDENGKTEALCHSRCGTIKIPPCPKALGAYFLQPFTGNGFVLFVQLKLEEFIMKKKKDLIY